MNLPFDVVRYPIHTLKESYKQFFHQAFTKEIDTLEFSFFPSSAGHFSQ
jgi:hypothetical protein